jgi:tetratricopeptide (TPR) repeat protein
MAFAGRRSPPSLLPTGVTDSDYQRAARSWKQRYGRAPDEFDVFSWLGESAVAAGDLESAVACFERIPSTHPVYGRPARHQQGEVLQKLNRLSPAEDNLREYILLESAAPQPQNELLLDAMQRLRSLLELELRFEERQALLREMFRRADGDMFDALVYLFPNLLRWNGPVTIRRAEAALAADPECFEIRRAVGRYRTGQGRMDEARSLLDECLKERPRDLPTFAYLLECEHERGGTAAIADAVRQLPPPADDDPWLLLELRGRVANDEQRFAEAVDCFEKVLRADPANATCHNGIATAWRGLHETGRYERELDITAVLTRIQVRVARLTLHGNAPAPILEIAEMCEQLGLHEHALLLARQGRRIYPRSGEFHALCDRLQRADRQEEQAP